MTSARALAPHHPGPLLPAPPPDREKRERLDKFSPRRPRPSPTPPALRPPQGGRGVPRQHGADAGRSLAVSGLGEGGVLQTLSYAFDFVGEILTASFRGGLAHSAGRKPAIRQAFANVSSVQGIDTVHTTPSFFRAVAETGARLEGSRVLHLGGEALSRSSSRPATAAGMVTSTRMADVQGDRQQPACRDWPPRKPARRRSGRRSAAPRRTRSTWWTARASRCRWACPESFGSASWRSAGHLGVQRPGRRGWSAAPGGGDRLYRSGGGHLAGCRTARWVSAGWTTRPRLRRLPHRAGEIEAATRASGRARGRGCGTSREARRWRA